MHLVIITCLTLIITLIYSTKAESEVGVGIKASKESLKLLLSLRKAYRKNYPTNFIADIASNKILKSIKKIPKQAYCIQDVKKIKVKYLFLRDEEETVLVENVENPYVKRFQKYFEVYREAKWFLDNNTNIEELKSTLLFKIVKETKTHYTVRTRKKKLHKGNYTILYISKKTYDIQKVIQYKDYELIGTLSIGYIKIRKYKLPKTLNFHAVIKAKVRDFNINIYNYRLNINLNADSLIELQDDCPSLKKYYTRKTDKKAS